MNTASIQSARYATPSTAIDAPVIATRESGLIEARRANDDIEGGGMLAFLAGGGTIDAYVAPVVPVDPRAAFIPVSMLRQRIEKLGMWEGFAAYLVLNPTDMLKVLTVEDGLVDPAYPALTTAFDQLDVPPSAQAYILADRSVGAPDV